MPEAKTRVVQRRRRRAAAGQERTRKITVRLTPGEWQGVQEQAQARGLSVAAYLGVLAEDVRRQRPVLSTDMVAELVDARQQVRRVGSNVNQIAAAVNTDGDLPPETGAVLAAVNRAIVRLEQAADRVWSP